MSSHGPRPASVAIGEMPMTVLRRAYAAAVRRKADSAGTLDVLAQASLFHSWIPPWLLTNRRDLMRMAYDPRRIPSRRTAGEDLLTLATGYDPEVRAILREVEWNLRRLAGPWSLVKKSDLDRWETRPRWTPGVRAMLAGTLTAGRDYGVAFAGLTHLMLGLLRLPDCTATREVFPYENARSAAVQRLSEEPGLRRSDRPYPDLDLEKMIMSPTGPLLDRLMGRSLARVHRVTRIGPLFNAVETESRRQAARLGHNVVGAAHTLLAMLTVDTHLHAARFRVPADHSSRNRGASVLRACGVDLPGLRELAANRGGPHEPPAEVLAEQLERIRPGDPCYGSEAVATFARAKEISLAYRHADTGTSHLLFALIEADHADAAGILRGLGVDPAPVRQRVEQDLRAAPAAWG